MEVIIIQRVFKFMRLYVIIKGLCLEEVQVLSFGNSWEAAKMINKHWLTKEGIKYWKQYPNNQVKLSPKRWTISLVRQQQDRRRFQIIGSSNVSLLMTLTSYILIDYQWLNWLENK